MAELPCAVPLSKKHIYDGLLSSPAPTKRNESAFSFRIDDYREIFSPSKASLGLSIPTLDLPAVDQTDTSTVDYAGVFGGVGDGHRVEEELFRKSKRKSKRDSQPSRSSTQTKITDTESQDLSCNSGNDQASTSPEKTEIPPSKSEELGASSKNIQASSSVSSCQPCDAVKDFDDSNDKTNQLSKDDIDGTANIAGLHTVPEYTRRIDEVGPTSEAGLVMDKCMSTDGNDKQANDHDAGLQKEFDRDKCDSFDASHSTREANCEPQTYSASTLSSPPKLYSSSNEYFRRSSSLRSKSSKNNQRSSAAADSPPLLDEELDVNSAAAVSAAAMKRAIEEAEAKIRSAKEILKGREMDGSGRLSFKNSFKFNATSSETNHSYAACGLKPNDSSNVEATMQNESVNEDKVVEQKDDLKTKATADGQLEDEGGVAMKKHVVHRSTCAPETFIETHESSHPPEYVNDAELETSRKHEGVGEWEATKHLSQLFTGVKNRFVSFISKQADAEKIVLQEDDPSGSGSSEQSERSTYQVQDADAHISAADQDQLENDVEMNGFVSSEVGESAQDSNRVSLEIHKLEEIVEEVTVSSDVKVPSTGQSNLSEPEEESNKVEVQESVEVKQQDEKGQMDNSELEQHDMNLDTTYQTRKYDPEERNCEENNEEEEQLQDQGVIEEEVYESFDDEDEIWRQEEGYSCNETEMPENCEKKLQDIEMAEDTHKERVQASTKEYSESFDFQDVKGKATVGPIDVVDDTSEQDNVYEHDADNAHEHVVCADNVCEHDESLLLSKSKEACLHVERSPNAQLVESSSEAEGRMRNLATSPIEHKVNDEHPVIEPKVNYEKPVIEPKVNDEQPKIETKVNDEQPIIEPKLNDEQPVIEPKLTDKQPIIEPKVNDEQPSIETKVNDDEQPNTEPKMKDEQLIIEPKVNDEQGIINRKFNDEQPIIVPKVTDEQQIIEPKVHDAKSIIEPRVFDEQPNIETGVTDEQPVIEPKVNDEQPIIESKMNDEQPVIEPKVNGEQPIIEPKLNDEQPIIEFKVNDEQPILEPKMPITEPKVTHEQPITEPKAIIEPKVNDEQLITEPKVNHEKPIIEAKVNDEQPTVEPLVNDEQPTIKPNVNVEQPICPEVANQLVKEDIVEQPRCSFEVVDNFLEQDHYFHAVDNLSEQDEKSSLSRNGASGYDDGNQYSQDVDFTSKNERMAESISTTSETKGNLEQPRFIHTINELIGKEMLEPTGCSIEVANETLDHNECPPRADYACMLEDDSYLDGKSKDYDRNDRNNCDHNVEFCFEDDTSKPEWNVEQPSCVQNMTGTTAAAGDSVEIEEEIEDTHEVLSHTNILKVQQETDLNFEQKHVDEETFTTGTTAAYGDSVEIEEEIEDTHEVLSHTNILKVQQETDLNFEQKHVDEETFTTDIGLENQVDESLFRTDMGEVYMASDQDKTMSGVETSNKRKRWFEKDEMRELYQCDILLGDEIDYEGVKIHVSESGECTNARQDDSCSGLEDGYSTEPTQRRRRWFQDRGEEVIHKPSVYYVAEMTTDMDDEIAQESEIDKTLQDRVHSLVNDNVANDQAESTSNAEAAPRRRRWFENRQKSGPAQRPSILVDNVTNADRGDIEQGVDAAIHDEAGKKAATGVISDRVTQKEKERKVVDRAIRAARLRAFVEARERAAVEVRQKAAATAQDQQGKASSEIKTGSDRASMDAKLKVERAAVERATAEARERALQKAMSEKAAYERDPNNQTSGPSCSKGYSSAPYAAGKSSGATSESPRRRKAISERNRRIMERAAKALEEKNLGDSLAQNEQAERDMFADILDGEVKRWLIGKDGNLRSLLSTLQYILGPDSGWQPIPLSDLIDPTSVRKAYKRAALCVHPDKLQQRGATIQQKYICEKVFDVLKDAWKWHELIPDDI